MGARLLEITDLLWPVDAGGALVPVAKADVLSRLWAGGQDRAARIVSAFPDADGFLDPAYIDALGLRVHRELQRLGEELQFGRRVGALLRPVTETMRGRGAGPLRVVDVGCGLGFVVRAMAASSALGTAPALLLPPGPKRSATSGRTPDGSGRGSASSARRGPAVDQRQKP